MKKKKLMALMLSAAMALSLTACGGGDKEAAESTASGSAEASAESSEGKAMATEIRLATNANPTTLDSTSTSAAVTRLAGHFIYEGLFEMNSKFQPTPQLCKEYSVSEDGKEWTFTLQQGVTFHDGSEMKAEDVAASLNRWASKDPSAATVISNGEQFEVVDDYTVKIALVNPCFVLPSYMVTQSYFPAIMPKSIVDKYPDGAVEEFIGTGPLSFAEWEAEQYVHYEKYDEYWGTVLGEVDGDAGNKVVNFEDVYLHFVPDTTVRSSGAVSGEYDIADNISYDYIQILEESETCTYMTHYETNHWLFMNNKEGLMSNLELRKALAIGLTYENIMDVVVTDKNCYSMSPSYMAEQKATWYTGDTGSAEYNIQDKEAAKKLVADNYDGTPVRILTTQTYQFLYDATLALQAEMEELGFKTELVVEDWATMLPDMFDSTKYDVCYMSYPLVAIPACLKSMGAGNAGFVDTPELTEYMSKINAAATEEEQAAIWKECQEYLYTIYPTVKLGDSQRVCAVSNNVNLDTYTALLGMRIWGLEMYAE